MKLIERSKLPAVAAFLGLLMIASGCGSDESSGADNNSLPMNNGSVADTSNFDPVDTSTYSPAADAGTDASSTHRYLSALADLGEPDESCSTPIVNADATEGSPRARIFVPNYRLDFEVLTSQQTFREHIHELVHEQVLPCRIDDRPTVVLFPESMGLPMLLIGDKAAGARQMSRSLEALTSMVDQVDEAFLYYGEMFPDTSITNRLLLSLTDSVVRATYDTFGQIADRYNIFVSVTVVLPAFEKVTDPSVVERLGDPDYGAHDYAYQATESKIYNRQILFAPDGEVVDETFKTYLSDVERDQLDLTAGDFTDIHPMETPWGKTGVVLSQASMPDVQDRLDDLGAEVYFQPESSIGGWITPLEQDVEQQEEQARWEPDAFMLGGWSLVQRAPRATHNFVSQLTGNFFEVPIDGQVQFIEKASRRNGAGAFVGQRGPLSGNTFIGPWVVDDPGGDNASLTLAERRTSLRNVGTRLLPQSGEAIENDYVEGLWAADLRGSASVEPDPGQPDPDQPDPDQPVQVQTHPQIATHDGAVYVISSAGTPGERLLRVERYVDDTLTAEYDQRVSGYDLVRPALAAGADTLHIVAELIGDDENRLAYIPFDLTQQAFVEGATVLDQSLAGQWAFHPSVAIHDHILHLSWIKRVDEANRAFYVQTSVDAPFQNMSVNTEVELKPDNRPALRANQWDARLAVDSNAIAITWIDFQHGQWEVLVSVSTDGGLNWSAPTRIDAVPDGVEALHSTPTIESLGDGRFLIAWTDVHAARPTTRIAWRTVSVDAGGAVTLRDAHLVGQSDAYTRWMWRPAIVVDDGIPALIYEVLDEDTWAIERVTLDANDAPSEATTLVASSPTAKHFPAVNATAEGTVIAFEEVIAHERTASSVEMKSLSP